MLTFVAAALLLQDPAPPPPSSLDIPALLQRLSNWAVGFAPSLVGALLTLLIGIWLARLVTKALRGLMARGKVDSSLSQFLAGLAYYGLLALVFIAVAGKLGVETTSFVALLGAVGLAVGFALQGSLGNLAAGVMILFFRPFRVGDIVEAAGQAGQVMEIGVFATTLATPDNRKVILPNSAVTGGSIVNATGYDARRVDLTFSVAPDEDIAHARAVACRVAAGEPKVRKSPAPEVIAVALPEGVQVRLMAWVESTDYLALQASLLEQVRAAFGREGVRPAVPRRDVLMLSATPTK